MRRQNEAEMIKTRILLFTFILLVLSPSFGCAASPDSRSSDISGDSSKQVSSIAHDPIERDPRYKSVFANIDAEVDTVLKDHPLRGCMGFCHIIWETKKEILKEKYEIPWKTPAEMNPHILFD
ncbi:MAG: hypothetical protein JXI32_03100 [Deltaproteobacteria bacterium]|nr:hypothetical protein [Deltaproteobacteria bacterium]